MFRTVILTLKRRYWLRIIIGLCVAAVVLVQLRSLVIQVEYKSPVDKDEYVKRESTMSSKRQPKAHPPNLLSKLALEKMAAGSPKGIRVYR